MFKQSKSLKKGSILKRLVVTGLSAAALIALPVLSHARDCDLTTITLGDGSEYCIGLSSHEGPDWVYSVKELSGKSLSHWNVGIKACMDIGAVVSTTPTGDVEDGSTTFKGMKWNVDEDSTEWTFTITLDADYPETTILAQAKAGTRGNERTGDVKGPDCKAKPLSQAEDEPVAAVNVGEAQQCIAIYGVHDEGLNDSQFVTIDPVTFGVVPLGLPHEGLDIEGLDINTKGELRGSSGDDAVEDPDKDGLLYGINTSDGAITPNPNNGDVTNPGQKICFELGGNSVCHREVSALSFRPSDGSLWAWAEECGLVDVDVANPANSRLEFLYTNIGTCTTSKPNLISPIVEDMTWDNAGQKIYFGDGKVVNVYDPATGEVGLVKNFGKNVEAVEALPDDTLLIGLHGASKLQVLLPEEKESWQADGNVGPYTDIEAIACLTTDILPPQHCIADWTYTKDSINDSTGTSPESGSVKVGNVYFEIYGIAVKMSEDTVTVAINSRLPIGGIPFKGKQISWGDIVFDFADKMYGVRFDGSNNSLDGGDETGLYEVTKLKSVSKANSGHTNFATYESYVKKGKGKPSLGDMSNLNNGYFGNTDKMPTSLASGNKVANITMLDAAALAGMKLDFATNLKIPASTYDPANPFSSANPKPANELGEYTIGFSFPRQDDMMGAFKAFIFTECGNDGIVMDNKPSCPMPEDTAAPNEDETAPNEDEAAPDEDEAAPDEDSVVLITLLDDKSKYRITLLSHEGPTWNYRVEEVEGKDLSHWNLGIGSCINVESSSPQAADEDGSTGFVGLKWDVNDDFTVGDFSITLDENYPYSKGTIQVQAKAGSGIQNQGDIKGPVCATPL